MSTPASVRVHNNLAARDACIPLQRSMNGKRDENQRPRMLEKAGGPRKDVLSHLWAFSKALFNQAETIGSWPSPGTDQL